MIEIRLIGEGRKGDILLKNDSFPLYGRMVPSYDGKEWSYTTQIFPPEECSNMTFPDEPYNYEEMAGRTFFIGAYEGERCVGLAVLEKSFFKYLYLSDLKVAADCRNKGVGRMSDTPSVSPFGLPAPPEVEPRAQPAVLGDVSF